MTATAALRRVVLRVGRALLTLLICVTIVFVVLRSAGDPLASLLPDDTPPDVVEIYRARLGLDRPILDQYLGYLASLAQGDFGVSFVERRSAFRAVMDRVPATLQLGLTALALAIAVGVPLGLLATARRDTAVDRAAMAIAVFGYSLPNFFLSILLILLFALNLRMLPSAGSDTALHMVMPVIVLAAPPAAKIARFTRNALVEVAGQPFMRTAAAKGVARRRRLTGHAMPNAAIPVVTFLGFEVGLLIGGAVVTEQIFAWPGIGRQLVAAVGLRDLPVVQTIVLLIAATMAASNLLVDLLYGWLDPRVRSGRTGS